MIGGKQLPVPAAPAAWTAMRYKYDHDGNDEYHLDDEHAHDGHDGEDAGRR